MVEPYRAIPISGIVPIQKAINPTPLHGPMTSLTFLGTGGGRFATITQARATGGLYLEDGVKIHIDPGPGALVNLHRLGLDPQKTDAILISHGHPDHYVDAPILLEALNPMGREPRGFLAGAVGALSGMDDGPPPIHPFHQARAGERQVMEVGSKLLLGPTVVEATYSDHSDPTTVGFKIHTNDGIISYIADTAFSEELIKAHMGARVLILPTTTPNGERIPGHLCARDSQTLAEAIKPELALLNHFGLRMLRRDPAGQAAGIEQETGVPTRATEDFMRLEVGPDLDLTAHDGAEPARGGSSRDAPDDAQD